MQYCITDELETRQSIALHVPH